MGRKRENSIRGPARQRARARGPAACLSRPLASALGPACSRALLPVVARAALPRVTGRNQGLGRDFLNLPGLKEARAPEAVDPDPMDVRRSREIKTIRRGVSPKP